MAAARFQMYTVIPGPRRGPGEGITAPQLARVAWRFLSANNRSIARSVEDFPDARACLAAVDELRAELGGANVLTSRVGPGMWCWQLIVDGAAHAVSSREYQRRIRARKAGEGFRELVPQVTEIDAVPLVFFDRPLA